MSLVVLVVVTLNQWNGTRDCLLAIASESMTIQPDSNPGPLFPSYDCLVKET